MSYVTEPRMEIKMRALVLLSAVAVVSGATLGAQGTPAKSDSTCTPYPGGRIECRVYVGAGDSAKRRFFFSADSALAKRAALGIEVRATGTSRDTLGVFVDAVTPKGPAESAGIVEGDRIAAINGVDLRTTTADAEDSYTNGLAAHRLTREVQKLAPGARVSLRVYSGGRVRDVQVTAGKASDVMRLGNRMMMPGMEGMMRFGGPGGGAMLYAPDMSMMRQRLRDLGNDPVLLQKLREMPREPMLLEKLRDMPDNMLLREKLRDFPQKIQLRTPMRYKTLAPVRERDPRVYHVEERDWSDIDEPLSLELDDEPFDFESEIEPVSPEAIRDLVATTVRDARAALRQLAAAGIV
jgi:PDZ domain